MNFRPKSKTAARDSTCQRRHKRATRNQPLCTIVGLNSNSEITAVRTFCKPLTMGFQFPLRGRLRCSAVTAPGFRFHMLKFASTRRRSSPDNRGRSVFPHKEPNDAITQDFGSATGACQSLLVLREIIHNSICSFLFQSCFIIDLKQACHR